MTIKTQHNRKGIIFPLVFGWKRSSKNCVCPSNPPIPSLIPNSTKMPQHGGLHWLESSKIQIIVAENCTNFKDKASDKKKDEAWSNGPSLGLFRSHEHFQLRQPPCLQVKKCQIFMICFISYILLFSLISYQIFSNNYTCILSSGVVLLTSYHGCGASKEVGRLESINLQKLWEQLHQIKH